MNAFEKMLREKFNYKFHFELLQVQMLEQILGPADNEKARKLIATIMDKKNYLVMPTVIDLGETAVMTYLKSLGSFGIKDVLLKAAAIVKQQ